MSLEKLNINLEVMKTRLNDNTEESKKMRKTLNEVFGNNEGLPTIQKSLSVIANNLTHITSKKDSNEDLTSIKDEIKNLVKAMNMLNSDVNQIKNTLAKIENSNYEKPTVQVPSNAIAKQIQ